MQLYIEIENGAPKNHPALEQNLLDAYGEIPTGWEPFLRVEKPKPPLYSVHDGEPAVYEKVDGVWQDVWRFRDMTSEEKLVAQNDVKLMWQNRKQAENFTAWVFSEELCDFVPPIPRPTDGKEYFWHGVTSSWVQRPPYPRDGKPYILNFTLGVWEENTELTNANS